MEHTAATVNLTISSCSLSLTNIENGHIIAKHDMPRISFASGGDMVNYICSVYFIYFYLCQTFHCDIKILVIIYYIY